MDARVCELFAGVGGFRVGLQAAGWEVKWSNQWEPGKKKQWASDCYVERLGREGHTNQDIATVRAKDIPDHELLVGGFPCQDYSVATTNAQGIQGKKGVLWWEIDRILRGKRPPYVLLENVDRLLRSPTSQRGRDFGVLLRCMAGMKYVVEWRVINAGDYGYPQKRRRVFIFAARKDTPIGQFMASRASQADYLFTKGFFQEEFPVVQKNQFVVEDVAPSGTLPWAYQEVSDEFNHHFRNAGVLVGTRFWTQHTQPDRTGTACLRDFLQRDVPGRYFVPDEDIPKWKAAKGAKSPERTAANGFKYKYSEGAIPFPEDLEQPARTILTSEGGKTPSRTRHLIKDPQNGRYRILTPEETEQLNGFDPGWTDIGMPKSWRYLCMGNALVVGLVKQMGQRLISWIEQPGKEASEAVEAVVG